MHSGWKNCGSCSSPRQGKENNQDQDWRTRWKACFRQLKALAWIHCISAYRRKPQEAQDWKRKGKRYRSNGSDRKDSCRRPETPERRHHLRSQRQESWISWGLLPRTWHFKQKGNLVWRIQRRPYNKHRTIQILIHRQKIGSWREPIFFMTLSIFIYPIQNCESIKAKNRRSQGSWQNATCSPLQIFGHGPKFL